MEEAMTKSGLAAVLREFGKPMDVLEFRIPNLNPTPWWCLGLPQRSAAVTCTGQT